MVEIFKRLLRNKVNKATIDRNKTKRKQKGKTHRIHQIRVEIFKWLLRNGTKKTDIDGLKQSFLIQHYFGPKGHPAGLPMFKVSKQVQSIYTSMEKLKSQKAALH